MAEQRSIIVKPLPESGTIKGSRNNQNLIGSFPSSPIFRQEITDQERRQAFKELVQEGTVTNGNGLNSFSRDYKGAPNLEEVETGGGGLPASPYMPNLVSPGPGSVSAADQIEYSGVVPDPTYKVQWGTGQGGLVSPSKTSEKIAGQNTLGTFISGRSYLGSDGKE